MSRKLRSTAAAAIAAAALGLSLIAASGPPALAGDDHRGGGHGGGQHGGVVTVATGLDNPRQLTVGHGNRLYVAEAGVAEACEPIPGADAGFQVCGLEGAVTEVRRHGQRRVVTDLPTMTFQGEVIGASDVAVRGNRIDVLIGGLAGAASFRADLPEQYQAFGTLRSERMRWGSLEGDDLDLVADINAFEVANNPDGNQPPDSNAVGLAALGHGRWAVADAGGNALLRVGRGGERVLAVFPNGAPVPNPFGPGEIAPQAVPTDVAIGPDGAYYVSQLTGFPFPDGGSTIWRVSRDGEVSAYATGLTLVTSLAWKGRTLYAVQLDDTNYLDGVHLGSLRRITPGGSEHAAVVDGLSAPYGVAVQGRSAYVTVDSISAGGGSVIRVDLR